MTSNTSQEQREAKSFWTLELVEVSRTSLPGTRVERRLRNDDWALLQTGRGTSLTPSLDISRQTLCQNIESEVNPGE